MARDNVIFLKHRSPHIEDDTRAFHACSSCRNKTYTLVADKPDDFPMLQCAACGAHIGRMGWAHDDDPLRTPPSRDDGEPTKVA